MADLTGRQINQYRVAQKLGEGGMGAVYRAHDVQLNRPVAFKVTHPHLASRPAFRRRFLQEAQAAARLDHPSIVKIFDFGRSDGVLYMVMEFVGGGSLGTYIRQMQAREGLVRLDETLFVLAQVADALDYAHSQGVIHRDIKPDNVMLKQLTRPEREGEPPLRAVVTDFGLAKMLEGGMETATGTVMGTLAYMSPEQALSQPLDGRSDIYSLGVLLYQLATGRLPFDIRTPTDAVVKHTQETPPLPQAVRPGLPGSVATVIERALAREPEARYQSAAALAEALRQAATGLDRDAVTRLVPPEKAISLVTQLQGDPAAPPSRPGAEIEPAAVDQLIVARQGATPLTYPLPQAQVTLGRTEENDVTLPASGVSRRHVRLDRQGQGWQVVDLDSTNGTYLEGNRLLPGVAESWEPGKTLQVGPFHLRWLPEAGSAVAGTTATPHFGGTAAGPAASASGEVGLLFNPAVIQVAPGSRAEVEVTLLNQSVTVDEYTLRVEGVPPDWISLSPATANLMPGDRRTLTLAVHPPRSSETPAGRHRYRLLVRSTANPDEELAATGQIQVGAYEAFALDMQPSRLQNGEKTRLLVHNQGNAPATYTFSGRDPAGTIRFASPSRQMDVAPGERATLAVQVRAARRPLLGRRQQLPFSLQMESPAGAAETRAGQLEVKPFLPAWLLPLAGVLLLLCLAGAAFGLSTVNDRFAAQTRVAQNATGTAVALAALAGESATLTRQAADVRATADFLTAQARGDDDGDGLSNSEERRLGTEPDNADTDGDGLTDYDEVRRYDTRPLKADTDDDGLADGQEVAAGTLPTNPDSDGDGTPDGLDREPLATPGPTATPTATPQPTPLGSGRGFLTFIAGSDLYRIPIQGGESERLQRNVEAGEWSPDGSRLAFIRNNSLHTMQPGGSNVLQLLPNSDYVMANPRWSPDGTMVALEVTFTGLCPGSCQPRIGVVDVNSADPSLTVLTQGDETTRHQRPRWAPDGSQILYLARRGPFDDTLFLVDLEGNARDLLALTDGAGDVAWAPGREIVYGAGFEDTTALYALDPAGSTPRRLTPGTASSLRWSPDGLRIAYVRTFAGEIWVLDTTRSNQVQVLATGSGLVQSPVWSPDGQYVAFADNTGEELHLYLVHRDGTGLTRLATHPLSGDPAGPAVLGWPP